MRVVQIVTRLVAGGAQRIVLETACEMARRGCESEIWCGPQEGSEGSLAEEARARAIRLHRIRSLVKEISPLRDLRAIHEISSRLRERRPDLIHTHSSKAGILGRIAAGRAGVGAVVHTVHGWGWSPETPATLRGLFVAAERLAARRCRRIVAVSRAARDEGGRLGIGERESYTVIPPGIDMGRFADLARIREEGRALRRSLGIPVDAFVAGSVGRLSPQKDPAMMLEAAIRAPGIHWILVGDGPLRGALEEEIRQAGIASRFHLTGYQPDPAAYLGALDLYVLTSRWEGLPLALIEARAAALPIVAAEVGGVLEVLAPPPAGLSFPAGDLAALVARIRTIAQDPAGVRAAAEEARGEALERYSLRTMLTATAGLYGEILGHPLPAPAIEV